MDLQLSRCWPKHPPLSEAIFNVKYMIQPIAAGIITTSSPPSARERYLRNPIRAQVMSRTKAIAIELPIIMPEPWLWLVALAGAGGPREYVLSALIVDSEMIRSALYMTLTPSEIGAWPKRAEPDMIFYFPIDSWIRAEIVFGSVQYSLCRLRSPKEWERGSIELLVTAGSCSSRRSAVYWDRVGCHHAA